MDSSAFPAWLCLSLLSLHVFATSSPVTNFCLERCECPHPRHTMCANRGLRAVPKPTAPVSNDTLFLSLGGNFITSISAFDLIGYSKLIRLNLQYNQVAFIHPKAFERLTELKELYIGHNLLTELPAVALQPLKKLTVLYGNNNAIHKVSPDIFTNMDHLMKLRLDGNIIETLQDSVFQSLRSLRHLHLEHNKVEHIHRNAFSKLDNLLYLNLAHNKQSALRNVLCFSHLRALTTLLLSENEIQYVGNRVFQNLQKLSRLSLSNNRIFHMEHHSLTGLSSLRELLIDGNNLARVPAGLLDPLEHLEELDLSHNRITNVDSSAFAKLMDLKVLKLRNNFLTTLSGDIFSFNKMLVDVDLHGNNWTCDCRLEELRSWMATVHSGGKLLTVFVQCRNPATLRGNYLDYVNSSQLQLSPGNWSRLCKRSAGPEKSQGEEVSANVTGGADGEMLGQKRAGESQLKKHEGAKTVVGDIEDRAQRRMGGVAMKKEDHIVKHGWVEIQGDQSSPRLRENPSFLKRKKPKRGSRRGSGSHRSKVLSKANPSTASALSPTADMSPTTNSVQSGGTWVLKRSDQLLVITDPCDFNRNVISNVSVAFVTSSSVSVLWSTKDHLYHTEGVHYRIMFDRFGTPDRFPRYVYAPGGARSVRLRELSTGVTYMVCVEGVVRGSVCPVAPREHCTGLITLSEGLSREGSLTSDLHLVTLVTLVGNALLLVIVGGVWLNRKLRKRMQRRKSAVHVRRMYSTRRPFRPTMPTASSAVSTDFTCYQSSRPARLAPLEEGDLIEFPCERFLDNSSVRRASDMQS